MKNCVIFLIFAPSGKILHVKLTPSNLYIRACPCQKVQVGMKSHFLKIHGKRNCVIHRPCADSNVPFNSQDQYALMQKLFTITKLTKLYMFLIATKHHFRFHGKQWHNFNSDRIFDKLSYLCFYSTCICKIGIKLKFFEQPLLL